VSARMPPRPGQRDFEPVVVGEQIKRATTVPRADLLILGDSSALTGVNARLLGDALGVRVESLATLGWVGPAAYARLLERVAERTGPPAAVLLLMCGEGLRVDERTYVSHGFERSVMDGLRPQAAAAPQPALDRIYDRLMVPLVDPPLPGRLGFYYGWAADLSGTLARDRGTVVDPTLPDVGSLRRAYRFELYPPVEDRLLVLGKALAATHTARALVALSPLPDSGVGPLTEGSRASVLERVVHALGLPAEAAVASPMALPMAEFATFTHLSAHGRETYTAALARALKPRLAGR
jgi:hypothetical protein